MREWHALRYEIAAAAVAGGMMFSAGCQSPFEPIEQERDLRASVHGAIERELRAVPERERRLKTVQPPAEAEEALRHRRDELDALTPAYLPDRERRFQLGPDLTGEDQAEVGLSLQAAIASAVRHNLGVQLAQMQPAITEADVVAAEADFDAVFFTTFDFERLDEPTTVPVVGGVPLGTGISASRRYRFNTGIRKPLVTGGEFTVATDVSRTRNLAPGFEPFPDPAYASALQLGFTQPLLRGFGSDVNRASIRLARNLHRRAIEDLRLELLELVAETEQAYWDLILAWRNVEIQQWLVDEGVQVRDVLERRLDFDARLAEYADAVATVEQRKSDVIRARRELRAASDRLKGLMNDPELTAGSEAVIQPVDEAAGMPIAYDLYDAIVTAVANRPEIQQAILEIDDASIRQTVADNLRLPMLNLRGDIIYSGLDDSVSGAFEELGEGRFISYLLGLTFEMPIGNRAAEAEYRQARLQRSATVIAYRQAVQSVILDVKNALRDVVTSYELIQATRSFRVAQAENLRALLVREELVGLTPEFLNLKFTRQNTLAQARLQEIQAQINFDQSVAQLYRAMGIGLTMNQIDLDLSNMEASGMDAATPGRRSNAAPR